MAYWMRACSRNTAGPWNRDREREEKGGREGESVSKTERVLGSHPPPSKRPHLTYVAGVVKLV